MRNMLNVSTTTGLQLFTNVNFDFVSVCSPKASPSNVLKHLYLCFLWCNRICDFFDLISDWIENSNLWSHNPVVNAIEFSLIALNYLRAITFRKYISNNACSHEHSAFATQHFYVYHIHSDCTELINNVKSHTYPRDFSNSVTKCKLTTKMHATGEFRVK